MEIFEGVPRVVFVFYYAFLPFWTNGYLIIVHAQINLVHVTCVNHDV